MRANVKHGDRTGLVTVHPELFDEKAVDAVLEMPMQSSGFNLHFDVPEAFAELDSFLVQSAEVEVDSSISREIYF